VGPTERDKTDGPLGLNDGWVRRPLGAQRIILKTNGKFVNPVRTGFDQFLVKPHFKLEFCRAIQLNPSQT